MQRCRKDTKLHVKVQLNGPAAGTSPETGHFSALYELWWTAGTEVLPTCLGHTPPVCNTTCAACVSNQCDPNLKACEGPDGPPDKHTCSVAYEDCKQACIQTGACGGASTCCGVVAPGGVCTGTCIALGGTCPVSCGSQTNCFGTCVNTSSDPQNCGQCGNKCSTNYECDNGVCSSTSSQHNCVDPNPVWCDCTSAHCTTAERCKQECGK
jgi:hypothetical protein